MKRFFKIIIVFLFVFNIENVSAAEIGQFNTEKRLHYVLVGDSSYIDKNYTSITSTNDFIKFNLNSDLLYSVAVLQFYINNNYNFNNEYLIISGYYYNAFGLESSLSNGVLKIESSDFSTFCENNTNGVLLNSDANVYWTPFSFRCYMGDTQITTNSYFKFYIFFNNATRTEARSNNLYLFNHLYSSLNPNNDNEVKSAVSDIQSTINSDNVEESNSSATDYFNNFDSGDTGSLMNLVSLPLKFLGNLNNSCTPIILNTGYLGTINLPCLSSYLYNYSDFAGLFNIISLVLNGLIMYGCIKSIINCVSKLKNPDNDEVEVMDL